MQIEVGDSLDHPSRTICRCCHDIASQRVLCVDRHGDERNRVHRRKRIAGAPLFVEPCQPPRKTRSATPGR